jgi:dephospho-CoA kinase
MSEHFQRIIAITGGISTGKTTVSRYLCERYQLPILDADIYAREAVEPGSTILQVIFDRYGERVKLLDGTLARQQLGEIIFNHPEEKRWLELQIHPYVRDRFIWEINRLHDLKIIVLAIPLLFEAKMTDLATEIWLVYCSREEQIERLMKRDRLTQEQAIARINSQLSLEEKIPLSNVILNNSSSQENLFHQIDFALTAKNY